MKNGRSQQANPASSEHADIAARFAIAKARKEQEEAQGLRDTAKDNKAAEVRFKATHGLLVAFLLWILYAFPLESIKAS
jgi:hypothetical protein